MPPKRPPKNNLPVPLQEGIILKDTGKKEWRLGRMISQGGFGLIYLASPRLDIPVEENAAHVIKVEYLENGPLFSELKFYQRAAKQECIKAWMKRKRLAFLGIPVFWGGGQAEHSGKRYRFMVMERLGEDLQTTFEQKGRRLDKGTVLQIGLRILDILEYIHENEYVHGDIKAANLLFGYRNPHEVYLADYGLAYRYCPNGNHKEYRENPKNGHNGTIEFTSLDAHRGVAPSRRGDLEMLGYCMLQWICGRLPWEQNLKNPKAVQEAKTKLLDELPDSVTKWAPPGTSCDEIATFLKNASELTYDGDPEYEMLKKILSSGLEHRGHCYDSFNFITVTSALTEHAANPRKRVPSQTQLSALFTLCGKAEQKFMFNKKPLDFDLEALTQGSDGSLSQTDLPKLTPEPGKEAKENKQENKKLAYQRKATVRTQHEQLQAQGSKPLQTQERKELPPGTCPFHKTFQKIEEKSIQNGVTHPPICQPLPSSSRGRTLVLSEELYQYIIAIAILLLLIPLSLYFL